MRKQRGPALYNKVDIRGWKPEKLAAYKDTVQKRNAKTSIQNKKNKQLARDYQSANGGLRPKIVNGQLTKGW